MIFKARVCTPVTSYNLLDLGQLPLGYHISNGPGNAKTCLRVQMGFPKNDEFYKKIFLFADESSARRVKCLTRFLCSLRSSCEHDGSG